MIEFTLGASEFAVLTRRVPFKLWLAIYSDAEKPSILEDLSIGAMAYLALQGITESTDLERLRKARTIGDFREFVIGRQPIDKLGHVALAQIRRIGRGTAELSLDHLIDHRRKELRSR